MRRIIFILLLFLANHISSQELQNIENRSQYNTLKTEIEIFPNTKPGAFKFFRIPSLSISSTGVMFAFCEGRKELKDNGDIDILLKVSTDGGKIWKHPKRDDKIHQLLIGRSEVYGIPKTATWRNPTSVYKDGKLYLFVAVDPGGHSKEEIQNNLLISPTRFFFMNTTNPEIQWPSKMNWSNLKEIEINDTYRWGAFGPGNATFKNDTLIAPMNTNNGKLGGLKSFCIYSSNDGMNWKSTKKAGRSTENQAVVLKNGSILMSKRACYTQHFWLCDGLDKEWRRLDNPDILTAKSQTGFSIDQDGTILISGPTSLLDCNSSALDRNSIALWWNDNDNNLTSWQGPVLLEEPGLPRKDTHGYSSIGFYNNTTIVIYEDSKNGEPYKRIVACILKKN